MSHPREEKEWWFDEADVLTCDQTTGQQNPSLIKRVENLLYEAIRRDREILVGEIEALADEDHLQKCPNKNCNKFCPYMSHHEAAFRDVIALLKK